jgi:hypothetical protein
VTKTTLASKVIDGLLSVVAATAVTSTVDASATADIAARRPISLRGG